MVIPFIALYLTDALDFTLIQVGWVMTCFGLGSMLGSYIGGKLTDIISYYRIMVSSLIVTGISFLFLFEVKTFSGFCIAIFLLMIAADSFRPAVFAAISAYSKPENRVRSISLIRLAINLGFSFGPAVGGFLIFYFGYQALFYIDGITCVLAGIFIIASLSPKRKRNKALIVQEDTNDTSIYSSVWKDKPFLLLILILFLVDFVFVQLFANVPLFYRDVHHLNEKTIGWLLALNGILIFVFEMPLVSIIDGKGSNKLKILLISNVLIALSYFTLNLGDFFFILVVSMVLITIGEMLGFPFSNSFAIDRAPKNRVGEYMGLYTVAFSAAHVVGPNIGMRISENYGFYASWSIMGIIGLISVLLCFVLLTMIKKESSQKLLAKSTLGN